MKFIATLVLAALFGAASPALWAQHNHGSHDHGATGGEKAKKEKQAETLTVTGELLDLACYMAHDGKGKEHKKCAEACVRKGGVPVGLLTKDGGVYLLVEDHAKKQEFAKLKEWVAEQVTVSGKTVSKGGVQAVIVASAQKK